jgi:hypothetical protein
MTKSFIKLWLFWMNGKSRDKCWKTKTFNESLFLLKRNHDFFSELLAHVLCKKFIEKNVKQN